jgi:hypothetical protein
LRCGSDTKPREASCTERNTPAGFLICATQHAALFGPSTGSGRLSPPPTASRAGTKQEETMRHFATHFLALLAASALSSVALGVALV